MGMSTDGIICFGIDFEEGTEFPWSGDQFDGDIEEWWRKEKGYITKFHPYDANGNYLPGIGHGDPRFNEEYKRRAKWDIANPLPVEVVHFCSGDYPMHIIAVAGTYRTACRGEVVKLGLRLECPEPVKIQALYSFLREYNIDFTGEAGWLLASYWG